MAVDTVATIPVLAPNLLHVVEIEKQTEIKTEGERER